MEIWKPIQKWEGNYEISNFGRIRSTTKVIKKSNGVTYTRVGKVLKPDYSEGYGKGAVCFNKKIVSYKTHRLVAEAFIPNPLNKPQVNHKSGVKEDNRVVNLEWMTGAENIQHCVDNNLQTPFKGEEVGGSKLKEFQVLEIRSKFKPRVYTRKMLAIDYNITEATIKDILQKRTWKHLL